MKTEVVRVTPEIAKEMLDKINTKNRTLSIGRARALARAMEDGQWEMNGDSIKISDTGILLDGQHRLTAIVISKTTQDVLFVTGLKESVFTTIDVGANRTSADMLSIAGVRNSAIIASSVMLYLVDKKLGKPLHGSPDRKPTKKDISEFVSQHRDNLEEISTEIIKKDGNYSVGRILNGSGAFYATMKIIDKYPKDIAFSFLSQLRRGVYDYEQGPVECLRNKLISSKMIKSTNLTREYEIALFIKAFNAWIKGEKSKLLKLNKDESTWWHIE